MSVLSIEKLTMRFGGITAVSGLDLSVEPGQVVSVIGPNGAGKTTVFNAVTGIYAPTSGTIRFGDGAPTKSLTGKVVAGFAAAGLVVAALAGLVAAGVGPLWAAAVTRPFPAKDMPFAVGPSLAGAWDYLRGEPGVVPAPPGWEVVALDGTTLGAFGTEAEARAYRATDPANTAAARAAHRRAVLLGAAGGFAVGALGAAAVWWQTRRTPDAVAMAGIARTFQNIRLFPDMTVLENVLVGLDRTLTRNVLAMALRTPAVRREEAAAEAKATEWLAFVGLTGRAGGLAKNLPYGDQRRLEIARALATGPKLLLLDEPAAGMNPSETAQLTELIRRIRDRGVTVLLIEHHMSLVMGISDRVAVLDYGVKIADGPPAAVSRDPKVVAAYLGTDEDHHG